MSVKVLPSASTALDWISLILSITIFFLAITCISMAWTHVPGTSRAERQTIHGTTSLLHWDTGKDLNTIPIAADALPAGVTSGSVHVTAPVGRDTSRQIWHLIGDLLPNLLVLGAALTGRLLVPSIKRGEIFTAASVKKTRVVAGLLMLASAATFVSGLINVQLMEHSPLQYYGVSTPYGWKPYWALLGLIFLVVAEVFRRGYELDRDLEGTV